MKIRNKIFLNFFLVSFFSLAAVAGSLYYFGRKIIIENIAGYNYLLAQSDIDSVDRFIDRRLEQWEAYVRTNPELAMAVKQSNEQFSALDGRAEFIKMQDSAWQKTEKASTTPFINNILASALSGNLRSRAAFYEKKAGYKIFPEIFVTNRYGALVGATGKTSDYLQADEEWWQKAKAEGNWVGDVTLDESSGVYGLEFCIRVDDEKGDFIGVAKAVYNIKDIAGIIDNVIKLSADDVSAADFGLTRKTVSASLLTKDGKLIYSTINGFGNLKNDEDLMSTQKGSYFIRVDKGVEELYSHAHSRGYGDFEGFGWLLIMEKTTSEVLAPLESLMYWLLIVVLAVFTVVIIMALLVSYSFNKPIKKLMGYVEQVESGDLSVKISALGRDEIGQLAKAFGNMVKAVKRSRKEVDEKVAAQTVEIKQKAEDLADQKTAILNVLEDVEVEKDKAAQERDKVNIILHSIGDGVFVVDKDERLIIFNQIAEKISGFNAKEALGKKYGEVLKFIFEKEGKINDEFIKKAFATGEIKSMANHTVLIRKDGTKVPVADSAAPFKDKNGQVVGCVVVFRDVTKEREIDRMKSEFVSVASHQLRTPLTGIKWFSELLLKNKLSAENKDYVKQISISNERMVRLVDDLLNVSRIETGRKFDLVIKNTDVVPIIESVMQEQWPGAKDKNISLVCATDAPRELILPIDELKMRQAFQNLISNSIKYSKGKDTIEIGCEQQPGEVIFYVKDNGIGIPKHQQSQVFNKFFRAENAFTAHTDGTGLGLYIVKAIVEAHGGKIWFESAEGKGTTFYFSLPKK
jgi:PAS domain S-box-containing protein